MKKTYLIKKKLINLNQRIEFLLYIDTGGFVVFMYRKR